MASGVGIAEAVVTVFNDMKMKSVHKYAFFKVNDAQTEIVVEKTGQGAYSDFIAELPADDCRYALFDFDYKLTDGGLRNKLLFIVWCPDSAKIKPKMLYSSSKDALKRKLVGFSAEIQATDFEELDYDEIYQKVSAGGTK